MTRCKTKAVVFDLDDTIGHFEQLGMFISALEQGITGFKVNKKIFNKILDLFPHFIRPGIIDSLKLLKKRKKRDKCLKVIIYTNNNGPRSWTLNIKNYLEQKINSKIFDRIITKYDHRSIINCRTTHNKTRSDLLGCSNLPKQTKILFFDDQYHTLMNHENIDYVKLAPYNFRVPPEVMIRKFLHSEIGKRVPTLEHQRFEHYILTFLLSKKDYRIRKKTISPQDRREKKKMLQIIRKFTTLHKRTRKVHNKKGRKDTRKKS